ncbi:hypothetical protein C1N32_20405 [Vibrio diazotrophicus]|uniref:Uncharacterized protein n=1 Tax=Vibrio diazotrophicus TaxID=685 RepID=A0A2J8HST6_VIBDI|nr:hypothetical protein [Vibrio diazotrophicus]PNI01346.1 hypothetical protein C1N32_20405 [Vibrio diazotrophicus]RAS65430.1 hypothetical protein DET48_107142 [Vibrio diazotrophicus]
MKHFLPSSVMLVPFVVKHYPDSDTESQSESEQNSSCDLCDDPTTDPQLKLSTENQVKAKKGRKLK